MRIATIMHDGDRRAAIESDGRLFVPASGPATLEEVLTVGADELAQARAEGHGEWVSAESADYALPIARPGKIVCVGLNFRDHAAEGGHPIPGYPALFMRTATSLAPHGAPLERPLASDRFDYEAELMAVIGRGGRHIDEAEALDHVFGYTAFNDGSLRDYQRKSAQWTAGKNFDRTGSVGPVVVTADELPAGAAPLRIACRVNGETLQDGTTADMIFPVARIVSILSEIMTLEPGDLIALGTPAGVGFARKPPVWLRVGDRVDVESEGIGVLANDVRDEGTAA